MTGEPEIEGHLTHLRSIRWRGAGRTPVALLVALAVAVLVAVASVTIAAMRAQSAPRPSPPRPATRSPSPGPATLSPWPGAAVASELAEVTLPVGSTTQTITVGGIARTFEFYRPGAVTGRSPVPLVVMLHGGFGSGAQAERSYGWDAEADRHRFVVAYPDGLHRAWNVGGGCCGTPGSEEVDDVAFIAAVVTDIGHRLPIDPRRVYATGISNGGMMDYRLACDTTIFAAIGPDSATLLGSCPHPSPVSVIHIHGLADTRVRFDGGKGDGYESIDGPPVPSVIASWRSVDRCGHPSTSVSGPVTTSTASCPDGRAVELITIAGAGHQWPGSAPKPLLQRLMGSDPPSTALDATDTIWRFFAAHPKAPSA